MEEKVLSSIGGIGTYGVISICIFFTFFTGMLVWVFSLRRSQVEACGQLPLDEGVPARDANNESPKN
jgi:hypothetical protein